jgi:nucleoside-diphosphate-sugar epimerase
MRAQRRRVAHASRPCILLTGAAGLIGGVLRKGLADSHHVEGLDIARGSGAEWVVDMRKLRRVERAVEGMDFVVDLAADSDVSASWESVLRNNVAATFNCLEAARRAGVTRVVFASSNHVVGLYERDEPYASVVAGEYTRLDPEQLPRLTSRAPIRPDSAYGVGKAFGEAAARFYAEEHGVSVLCLRIGTVNREDRPTHVRQFATLLTHRDLVQLVARCIEAPASVGFGIFYGVSRNTWRLWDIEEARGTIGYEPVDDTERWR